MSTARWCGTGQPHAPLAMRLMVGISTRPPKQSQVAMPVSSHTRYGVGRALGCGRCGIGTPVGLESRMSSSILPLNSVAMAASSRRPTRAITTMSLTEKSRRRHRGRPAVIARCSESSSPATRPGRPRTTGSVCIAIKDAVLQRLQGDEQDRSPDAVGDRRQRDSGATDHVTAVLGEPPLPRRHEPVDREPKPYGSQQDIADREERTERRRGADHHRACGSGIAAATYTRPMRRCRTG